MKILVIFEIVKILEIRYQIQKWANLQNYEDS